MRLLIGHSHKLNTYTCVYNNKRMDIYMLKMKINGYDKNNLENLKKEKIYIYRYFK